jgi:hypothetical protein
MEEDIMTIENKLVPVGATQLIDKGCHATAIFMQNGDGTESTKMNMVVYSGGVIKDHWYWDNLLIDLQGGVFSKNKYPVLEDHRTDKKIGFSGKPIIKDGSLQLDSENTVFVSTEESDEFQTLSKQGFPFQSSVRVNPKRIERISEGAVGSANGISLSGPATIFREWEYIEGSVCVFGWDDQTSAAAFTKDELVLDYELTNVENVNPSKEVQKIMNIEQFKKDHPDLFAEIVKTATDQVVTSFSNEKSTLIGTIDALTVKLSESDKIIQELAKKDAIRSEKELKLEADKIWATKLAASEIPERMFPKVMKNVDYNEFVKDSILDKIAFSTAIDTELKDWEDFKTSQELKIKGTGFSQKDVEKATATDTENEKLADTMFALAGGKLTK